MWVWLVDVGHMVILNTPRPCLVPIHLLPVHPYISLNFSKKIDVLHYKQVSLILASSPPLFFATRTQHDALTDVQKREK